MIKIIGLSHYTEGWIACYLGLLKDYNTLRGHNLLSFYAGWNSCNELPMDSRYWIFNRMQETGQITVNWVEE